ISEDRLMRITQELSSARSLARFAAVAAAFAVAAVVPRGAHAQTEAVYAVTYLDVGANAVAQGVDLLKKYRETSQHEAANLEFTILQETSRPNRFVIMEGWRDQAAFDAHVKAAATAQFLDALKPI